MRRAKCESELRPQHIQLSAADSPLLRFATLYVPDRNEWENYARIR